MKSYTFSEARQHFAALLDQAQRDGVVRVQRRDGQSFVVMPEPRTISPLAIPGITLSVPITQEDILQSIQEGRQRYDTEVP